ncbi:hypothetical protein SAMN05421835_104119 [Amycolatopsis sacchari]|uniref:Uncharacterized protein n=1 Tax=Amycolatopsis sacchari TaxID=115433 RepID=A0A1I3PZT8_9PSEU|nr:hypothetical protein SAMN05421835_104119 [Amycolatopsis sacchari]
METPLSQPIQSLHDLVLSLVTDGTSQSAFLADPAGVLAGAGLSDITAGDVQEVTALVTDHVPAPVAEAVESALAALPADLPDNLDCAIEHLRCVAGTLPGGLGSLATATSASDSGLAGSVAYAGEHVDSTLAAAVSGGGASVADTTATEVGQLAGSVAAGGDALSATTGVTTADAALSGALAAADGSVAGAVQSVSPAGAYAVGVDAIALPSLGSVGDLGSSLDSDLLGDSTPAVDTTGTYAHTVVAGAAGAVYNDSAAIAGYAAPVAGDQVANAVAQAGSEVAQHVDSAASVVPEALSHVPALPAPNLPVDLPADVPVHVATQLPQSLPDVAQLPHVAQVPDVAHDVVSTAQAATSGVVAHTGISDLGVLDHTAALPDLGDALHTDLPLGH